ncbi:DUF2489 domain-containing protein [Iodobacter fluviatilis]|uniref:Uncharacterized protein DUF2489 n=1 Tax=Iodobacter fluviatilis TaxID=537 RepID=A0A377QB74_9NEIS|nr:DUF2489 domain-containing protein [Iodobacter fluviatilis]TCU88807.1 uncharacterized protein DUF2489 [Iodobacter fluviatilis]STQ91121.1 Uncharacterised protein [Iodobacter fluviatilis]
MSAVITNESYALSVHKRVGTVAFGMLSGEIGFIEGAIELASLRHEAAVEENDPDFMAFVVIASETDSLPIGTSRELWSKEALAKHQPEIDAAIVWAKKVGLAACQSLAGRFYT